MRRLICFLTALGVWLLLFWSVHWSVILGGAIFSAIAAVGVGPGLPPGLEKFVDPRRWFFGLVYLPYFFYYVIKANLDVAWRVLHPDLPIRPGIVKIPTTLKSDLAKTFLCNSITMTPGTISLDVDGQDLYIHWINVSTDDPGERYRQIAGQFEGLLRRIFE
jgi:multicomponent Na+:H+ antiporter subunit E